MSKAKSLSFCLIVMVLLVGDSLLGHMSMLAVANVKLILSAVLPIPLIPLVREYVSDSLSAVLR